MLKALVDSMFVSFIDLFKKIVFKGGAYKEEFCLEELTKEKI